jgi:hypothetical protein
MPLAETLNLELMWMDAFGLLQDGRLKPNGGVWSQEVMEQSCIRDPELDKVPRLTKNCTVLLTIKTQHIC